MMLTKSERAAMRDLYEAIPYPPDVDDTELRLLDHADAMDEVIAGLVGALRRAEWGDLTSDGWGEMIERCPICDHRRENGHSKDCMLAAALAEPRLVATKEDE